MLSAAAPLITPYAFNYDLTAMAAAPFWFWILCGRLPWLPRWAFPYLLGWTVPAGMMFLNLYGLGLAPVVLIAMFGLSVREALANPAAADRAAGPLPAAA